MACPGRRWLVLCVAVRKKRSTSLKALWWHIVSSCEEAAVESRERGDGRALLLVFGMFGMIADWLR